MQRLKSLITVACLTFSSMGLAQDITMPSLQGVKISVSDFSRTTAFYTALGMHAGTRYNDHETSLEWSAPTLGVRIVMVDDRNGRMLKGGGFLMISVPDLAAAVSRLNAAGFAGLGAPRVTPRFSQMMIKDPDGNQIELLAPAPPAAKP